VTMNDVRGRTVRLFLVEGRPTGLIIAEMMNWTGQVLAAPRSGLATLLSRKEAQRPGVYALLGGDATGSARPTVYVGESDNVAGRIKNHDANKEFDRAWIITSKDANLTKGHILYLESRLIEVIQAAKRANLGNGRASDNRSLPEPDQADMEDFLQQLEVVLPIAGLDVLRPVVPVAESTQATNSVPLVLSHQGQLLARAVYAAGEVTVLKGSKALQKDFAYNAYAAQRKQLEEDGRLSPSADAKDFLVFTESVPFSSPSAAASVVLNRNSNGRNKWEVDGAALKLGAYQDAQLAKVEVSDSQ